MSHPASSRRALSRGRRAIGLFAAVWLNLALAPCTMALETGDDHPGDHDCPHCPPSQMQGHHEMHGAMSAQASCAEDLADCGLDDDFSHDARGAQAQLKDAQHDLPAFAVADDFGASNVVPARQRAPPQHVPSRLPPGPPIHLLNCVFLD